MVLYLRRPSRRPLEFSSLLFWQRVLEREPHRKFLGRLRNPLSLILQLVILLLLLLALARPQEVSVTRSSLDGCSSWICEPGCKRRVSLMRLCWRHRTWSPGLVLMTRWPFSAMEGAPRIVSSFSSDGKELRRKLSSLEPSDAGGNLDEALVLAADFSTLNRVKKGSSSLATEKQPPRKMPSRLPSANRQIT